MELVKYYAYSPVKVNMTYYRDSNAKEIDLLIEENNSIHPVEIKKSASPDSREIRKLAIIDKTEFEHGMGGIQCDIAKYPERRVIRLFVYSIPVDIY